MVCSKCKKRTAVVFLTRFENGQPKNEGLCLKCASELKIPEVENMLNQAGFNPEDIEEMTDMIEGEYDEDMVGGTNQALPNFFSKMFGQIQKNEDASDENSNLPANSEKNAQDGKENDPDQKDNGKSEDSRSAKKKKLKFLTAYCTNITARARENKLDPVIGRSREIARAIQILCRRNKNNPCLIGEPGVGKTAIAEGLAQRIASGDVPGKLMDKEIYLLDMTALVAGTQFRGQFESRIKNLIEEVKREGNIILFIDEVHTLVGAGDAEGSMNAANILKPALSRGEIQVIGATTFEEYRKNIEKDAALERRFQPITIDEPTISDSIEILKGLRPRYEAFHQVHISDELLELCVKWSERYITDRYLPDKAIDLLDESCACASLANKNLSVRDKMVREQTALNDSLSQLSDSTDNIDYEKISMTKTKLLQLNDELKTINAECENIQVTASDLAKVIELYTGIPSAKVEESQLKKIGNLKAQLSEKIIGQDEAIDAVVAAIKRSRLNLSARKRPASFIFVGPTGVGKTELVKALSSTLFDSVDPLIRLDMSEFMEKHSVARLIGSPPGYVGYDDAGQLTEKIRRKPYSVILFDEIEKAHPDVMNILLQILDEGKISDAHGRKVNFENTVIVMTSNAGSSDKSTTVGFGSSVAELQKNKVMKALSEFLRPEFLGRVDEVVVFNSLGSNELKQIAALLLNELKEPLQEKNIRFTYDDAALTKIAALAENGRFNARDIRKVIRKEVEDRIANAIIDADGAEILGMHLTCEQDNLTLQTL
jgi:ATP-dependent Clp protease ATP-binding subunit ClpA